MPPRRAPRSTSRKDVPVSPAKVPGTIDASHQDASHHNKRSSRSANREITAAQHQLQNIDQDPEPINERADSRATDGLDQAASAPSQHSSVQSQLQSELDLLDRQALIDNLTVLHSNSTALLSLLESTNDNTLRLKCTRLLDPKSPLHRRFQIQAKQLLAARGPYGDLDFINRDLVVCKIANNTEIDEINDGPWRPDAVLYLANLALQMMKVVNPDAKARRTYVDYMFNNFPNPFADQRAFDISSGFAEETGSMSVEILTQCFIQKVEAEQSDPAFDPDVVLREIFWDDGKIREPNLGSTGLETLSRVEEIREFFHTGPKRYIDLDGLKEQFSWADFVFNVAKWNSSRKAQLQEVIDTRGGVENLSDLLSSELTEDNGFRTQPSPDEEQLVIDNAAEEAPSAHTTRPSEVIISEKSSGPVKDGNTRNLLRDQAKVFRQQYKARFSGIESNIVDGSLPGSAQEIPQSPSLVEGEPESAQDDAVAAFDSSPSPSESPEDELIPTQQTQLVLQTIARQQEQNETENSRVSLKKQSFLDPQAGAVKVPFSPASEGIDDDVDEDGGGGEDDSDDDDDDAEEAANEYIGTHSSQQNEKRSRARDEEEDIDHPFETDTRALKKRNLGTAELKQPSSTTHHEPQVLRDLEREAGDLGTNDDDHPAGTHARFQSSRQVPLSVPSEKRREHTMQFTMSQPTRQSPIRVQSTQVPPSTAPTRRPLSPIASPPPRQVAQYNSVREEARINSRLSREIAQRPMVQIRRAYTEQEVARLMELVELHGSRWARILDEDNAYPDGPVLQGRTQVQLKDKARNIKLDFLKARRRLPPGFESVSVGQRQIGLLREMGITYVEGQGAARYQGPEPRKNADDDDDEEEDYDED